MILITFRNMTNTQQGSKTYLFSIVLTAVLGGLLFGYDTAVISGAEQGLRAFFMGASDFNYTIGIHGFTASSALIGCVIGSAVSGFFASRFGRKRPLCFSGVLFVPESPRYLVMTHRDENALNILSRINGLNRARQILTDIKETAHKKTERLFTYGWMVIFIGIMLSVFQQAVGINAVLFFAPNIFKSMGMGDPMQQTVLMGVVNILFTLLAVFTVERWGRKPLLISGSIGMAIDAFGVAMFNVVSGMPLMVAVVSIMIYSASFMFSWGPICWVMIAEIFPNTIRGAAVAVAVAFQWVFNFIVSSTFLPIYNMRLGEMGDKFGHCFAYTLYGVICVIAALFVWRLVPETKGKTLEEMTRLWKK